MTIRDCLSPLEIGELEKLNESPILMEALKKVLLYDLYFSGVLKPDINADPYRNFVLTLVANKEKATDEVLGQDLRASVAGLLSLEGGFQRLEKFKKVEENKEENKNEAR